MQGSFDYAADGGGFYRGAAAAERYQGSWDSAAAGVSICPTFRTRASGTRIQPSFRSIDETRESAYPGVRAAWDVYSLPGSTRQRPEWRLLDEGGTARCTHRQHGETARDVRRLPRRAWARVSILEQSLPRGYRGVRARGKAAGQKRLRPYEFSDTDRHDAVGASIKGNFAGTVPRHHRRRRPSITGFPGRNANCT